MGLSQDAEAYDHPDVPKDIYKRYRYCRCIVDYLPRDGKKQDIWSKKWTDIDKENFNSIKAKGQERIELIESGGVIQYRIRTSTGGLGEGFDLLVIIAV